MARPVVVDLGYGDVHVDGRPVQSRHDVAGLMDRVDATTVVIDGVRRYVDHAWQIVFGEWGFGSRSKGWTPGVSVPGDPGAGNPGAGQPTAGGPQPQPSLIVGHPSTWGRVRTAALTRAVNSISDDAQLAPRAVLIARSHADITVQKCAVVETMRMPRTTVDPAHPRRTRWDITVVRRAVTGWEVVSSDVVEAGTDRVDPDADRTGAQIESIIDDAVEVVIVDGADRGEVDRAIEQVTAHALAGRVVPADRRLVGRYGWRPGRPDATLMHLPEPAPAPAVPAREGRIPRAWLAAGAALALVLVVAAIAVTVLPGRGGDEPTTRVAQLGRTSVVVPSAWRESVLGPTSTTTSSAPTSGAGSLSAPDRTVFADPQNGRRVLVVQTPVRAEATLGTVATSLGNRIRQRGDDVVTEFSPSTRFAGREVISYRETPGSGSPIRWYVMVSDGLQVSVGCQAGDTGDSVDAECEQAVSSARIGQR